MRHTILVNGTDLGIIQELLSHKSSKTTKLYTHVSRQTKQRIPHPPDQLELKIKRNKYTHITLNLYVKRMFIECISRLYAIKAMKKNVKINENSFGLFGLLSVMTLIIALLIFGLLNSDFSFLEDYISKLGARGEPNAFLFNLIGFVAVGVLLFIFGFLYGRSPNDRLLAFLLSTFGLGFAFTAINLEMALSYSPFSKAHIVAICLGLAFWLFGISRLGYNSKLEMKIRKRANFTAAILVLAMIGSALDIWSMPVTHRLVFGIVLGWTAITSIEMIKNNKTAYNNAYST